MSLREIRAARKEQPLTIEVHEAAAADLATMKMLRMVLEDLKMKLAYDDFGAGQARLNELVEARPDYVKFDRKMIMRLDRADSRPATTDGDPGQHVPAAAASSRWPKASKPRAKPTPAARSASS